MKIKLLSIVAVLLLLHGASGAAEEDEVKETPREDAFMFLGLGLGGAYNTAGGAGPRMAFSFRGGWLPFEDLLIGYEIYIAALPIPPLSGYRENKHCLFLRYYPLDSLPGLYIEGLGGVLTNEPGEEFSGSEVQLDIDVPYAFFIRLATGYSFYIGTNTQMGIAFKYHMNFYHATPHHDFSLLLEFNWFLP